MERLDYDTLSSEINFKYREDGELFAKDKKIDWWDKLFSTDTYFNEMKGSLLYIGSGNGRLNVLLEDKFEEIWNIEPYFDIDERFHYDNVTYINTFIEDLETKKKFDVVFLLGSFHYFKNKLPALKKCLTFLKNSRTRSLYKKI